MLSDLSCPLSPQNRMGLTDHDLTSTSGGVTSRSHAGNTVETSVAAPVVSSRPDGTSTDTSEGTSRPRRKENGGTNLIMRALQRGKERRGL